VINGLLAATVAACLAFPAAAATLEIAVTGVRNAAGLVRLCLWTAPNGFPDCTDPQASARREMAPARPGEVTFRLDHIMPGTYAVTVFHDERETGKVATNFLGIPRDGLGASNDPKSRFGPPSFADAAFRLGTADARIAVTMVYP